MALRQRAYARRASQQEDLAESRSRHEEFRSSMFSTSRGFTPALTQGGSSGGGGSMDSERPTDRIGAAILAGMAVDAQRGANTFNTIALTPAHSAGSSAYQGVDPVPSHARPGQGTVSGSALHSTPAPGVQRGGGDGYYVDRGDRGYKTYHPPSGAGGGSGDSSYPPRGVVAGGSGGASDGSHGAGLHEGGGGSRGGESGSSISDVFRYSGEEPAHSHQHPRRVDSGGGGGEQSGSSTGGGSTERRRRPTSGERGENKVWRPDPSATAGAGGGRGNGRETGDGMRPVHQGSGSSEASDDRRPEVAGQEAFGAPQWNVLPTRAGSGGTALGHGEDGDSGGLALTPKGYDDPLELPDGCHHISLSKFLEVMTGPGLRVRKHHRAGKGSSGLRVLRYAPDEDSLTWDSHKILGAAQHVLPMADVTNVSMQSGNRVVLTCVGGRDSYAVFEAANNDAGAVLYVGLERLRKRTDA